MLEHYWRRLFVWAQIISQMRGVTVRDQILLLASAACAPFTSLARLDGFGSPHLLGNIDIKVADIGQFSLRPGTDDIIHVLKAREPKVLRAIQRLLREGDCFVDAGANIGFYSVVANRIVRPHGMVVAFEMMPPTATRLRKTLRRNEASNVKIVEMALSERDGDTVTATSAPDKFGQASIVANPNDGTRSLHYNVQTITLDTELFDVGPIRLIKMDLEGAEYLALCGASAVLARTEYILLESNNRDGRIFKLLEAAGFSIVVLDGYDYLATRSGSNDKAGTPLKDRGF